MEQLQHSLAPLVHDGLCVAFSGGVDSSLLLKIACDLGKQQHKEVVAVTFHTQLHPMNDLAIAKQVAEETGATHHVITIDELSQATIIANTERRCYFCKKHLFETLKTFCQKEHIPHIIDGTNEDDLHQYRPGLQALKELEILSPLAQLGISKQQVRLWANTLHLSVSTRPSAPCLATRIPYNTPLNWVLLRAIDQGEQYLTHLGCSVVRLRVHDNIARVELLEEDFPLFLKHKQDIIAHFHHLGFAYVTLDVEGFRSGSMDLHVEKPLPPH